MSHFNESFGAAELKRFESPGTFFRILDSLYNVDVVFFRNRMKIETVKAVGAGFFFDTSLGFDAVEITCPSAQTISFLASEGRVGIDRTEIAVDVSGALQVAFGGSSAQKTVANVSGQLVAQNMSRKYLLIQNNDGTGVIWLNFGVGAAVVGAGVRLSPGQALEFNYAMTSSAIQAIGSIASNANVAVVEG